MASSKTVCWEPTGLPYDVPPKWKKSKKSSGPHSGGEGEVTKICLNANEKMTAVIKVYTYDTRTRKMRAYREITALKTLKDLTNVSHLYSADTNIVTNVPDNLSDTLKDNYATFWAIMTNIEGVTLKEFVTKRYKHPQGFSLLDALTLTEKLLYIVKTIHAMGVVHRDLKPDNIMITYQNYGDPIEKAEIFVIDFGLAYIKTQENIDIDWSEYDRTDDVVTELGDSLGNRWYRVPQLDKHDIIKMTAKEKNDLFHVIRRSSTIDASSICAIFFWMLTQIVPQTNRDKDTNLAPHQRESANIKKKIDQTISNITGLSNAESQMLAKRLQLYLMTTFDKGFEFADRQWTIEQLNYRLQLIRNTLESLKTASSLLETLEDVSDALIKLGDTASSAVPSPYEIRSPLDKAASAFVFAKTRFIENHQRGYKWTDGGCQWSDDVNHMVERKHYDTLTYYLLNQNWSIIVCFTANVNETGQSVFLSIGSIVHGLYIGIPIGEYATNSNSLDKSDIYTNFERELKNLIHLICKRKASTR
ncbi:unnamed protein product [Adineta steineri]|uniref:Protein kinase domain-containing protein n=1 Tax=Adineta steineri TaxID=433720 RepID=A0A819TQA3_9BILA|nr:unnamed protein product [Adineta steineri]CAF4081544.1 unnamed protein product [Adineta steineri]